MQLTRAASLVLAQILRFGHEKAPLPRRALARNTGLPDRQVRDAIRELVLERYPVVASPKGGYFMATREEQLTAAIADLESRRKRLAERIESLERVRRDWRPEPQLRLV